MDDGGPISTPQDVAGGAELRLGGRVLALGGLPGPRQVDPGCERKLWLVLHTLRRSHGLHFRRQVTLGRYVADFACPALRVVVEAEAADAERRDAWFAGAGYRTVRIPDWAIANEWESVVRTLAQELGLKR
jgi:very-short-patch-repair endonuclease